MDQLIVSSNLIIILIAAFLTFIATYSAIDFLTILRRMNGKKRYLYIASTCALGIGIWTMNFLGGLTTVSQINLQSVNFPTLMLSFVMGMALVAVGMLNLTKRELKLAHILKASFMVLMAICSSYIVGMYGLKHSIMFQPVQMTISLVIIFCLIVFSYMILFYTSRYKKGNAVYLKLLASFVLSGAIIQGYFLCNYTIPIKLSSIARGTSIEDLSFVIYLIFFLSILVLGALISSSTVINRHLTKSDNYLKDIRYALDQSSIVAITDPKGIITYVNEKFTEISKYDEAELIGSTHAIVNSGYHSKEFFQELWETIIGGETWYGEICNKNKDGELYWVDTTIIPFMENGKPYQYISIRSDITSRKQAEELLHQQDKLAAVGQLAAGVAHEIRNPLTSMKGYAEFLHMDERDPNRVEFLEIILDEIDRVNQIVEEFMVLAKPQSVNLETKNIIPIIQNVLALMEFDAKKKNVTFYFESELDLILVRCDENRLKQVFLNFVKNGMEAMPNGGNIKVRTELKENSVQISIEDTGIGIAPSQLKKIGEPFYTTKKTGNGLGLMVSFKIIEGHRGKVEVESEVNKGTTFNILLPLETA